MECNNWKEKGLLFAVNELDKKETADFKKHLEECEYCNNELKLYLHDKETLFRPEFFKEAPSEAVDNEIIRICTKPQKPSLGTFAFPSFIKHTIFALLILIAGFSGGAYFTALISDAKKDKQIADINKTEQDNNNSLSSSDIFSNRNSASVTGDSSVSDSSRIGARPQGNLSLDGVVPVDLTDE